MALVMVDGTIVNGTVVREANFDIKVFNLTTLRKNGFIFTPDGELVKDNVMLSGKWLNKVDEVLHVSYETDDEIVVEAFGKLNVIPKSARKVLYKHI